jgi:3-hydroxyacyl-[acyl-carrier-protein] dehydratase
MAKWYSLNNINCSDEGKISADIKVKPDSPWFSGHFPDNPILPGIAQLAMVFDTIKQGVHIDFKISIVQRVRFKQIVKPGDQLKLTVQPTSKSFFSYSFRIMLKREVVCTGTMLLNKRD